MNREFLDHYNRELRLLYEQAGEFAEQYPGVAERLGGLVEDQIDPMIKGLLEGAAFLAARVQLKLKHEFPEFTNNLLEQLVPDYLAPTPSVMLVKATPLYGDAALRDGQAIPRGSYLDATYRELDRHVACRFRLSSTLTLLPLEITGAEYYGAPGPLQALGIPIGPNVLAGMRLSLRHRTTARLEDEPAPDEGTDIEEHWVSGVRVPEIPVHILGLEADAIALYEQIFANRVGIYYRYLDAFGDPRVEPVGVDAIAPVGFDVSEALFPRNDRIFEGFELLREYFVFPRKFLGFRLTGLRTVFPRLTARAIDVVVTLREVDPRLLAAVSPTMFSLYAAPAVNLFEKTTDRVPIEPSRHEHHIVPDRSRYLDYEPHRILSVQAYHRGGAGAVPVHPLYSAEDNGSRSKLAYTIRRMPRGQTAKEKQYGLPADYVGTDMFISLVETGADGSVSDVAELGIRALCSNRHLTENLPTGQGGADFRLLDNAALDLHCLLGRPTRPREAIVSQLKSRTESAFAGSVAWRLINLLSLDHLGLVERGAGSNAEALREVLSMFADLTDSATDKRIRGIRSVDSRPVVRRVRQSGGVGVARGVEITVTIDEKAFEGSGIFLLGAVLDRFYCEYAGINHFTETVIRSVERGEVMRWPVRIGLRRSL